MSKLDRTYAIITTTGFTKTVFADARAQGLFGSAGNCSFDTVRLSLDKSKAVVWWRGTMPKALNGLVAFQGSVGECLAYLTVTKAAEWNRAATPSATAATDEHVALATGGLVSAGRSAPVSPAPWGTYAAAAVVAAVAAGLIVLKLLGKI